jgi:hypothetical protein
LRAGQRGERIIEGCKPPSTETYRRDEEDSCDEGNAILVTHSGERKT